MKKILVTTTDTLYGWEIEAYLKPVFASVVIGANAFADIGAAFTDIFGGRSSGYEKRLQLIKDNAITILNSKASELGANCILGLSIDMDEISGKNTQMFMVTASGTAVIARNSKNHTDNSNSKEIDKDNVKDKANIIRLAKKFTNPEAKLTLDELQIIVESKSSEFKDLAFSKMKALNSSNLDELELKRGAKLYNDYFAGIDASDAIVALYNGLLTETDARFIDALVVIIKQNDLVDYVNIHKLLDSSFDKKKIAIEILGSDKPTYSFTDIGELEEIIEHIERGFPKLSTAGVKKGFLSSSEKEVWVCSCGKSNDLDSNICFDCSKDQYGFKSEEVKPSQLKDFLTNKLLALKSLL